MSGGSVFRHSPRRAKLERGSPPKRQSGAKIRPRRISFQAARGRLPKHASWTNGLFLRMVASANSPQMPQRPISMLRSRWLLSGGPLPSPIAVSDRAPADRDWPSRDEIHASRRAAKERRGRSLAFRPARSAGRRPAGPVALRVGVVDKSQNLGCIGEAC